jgi:phage gp29-like protein
MFGEWLYNGEARSGVREGVAIERGNFIVTEAPMALDRILSVQYFRRNLCMTDWDAYLSVYGIPSMFFVGPANCTPDKELEYLRIAQSVIKDGRGFLPNGTTVEYVNGGGTGKPPFLEHLAYIDRQITLVGTGGLLTMLTESGSGTLAGGAHSDAWKQICAGDAVVVSEACQRDFDKPRLDAAFPGWPVEAGFRLLTETPEPDYAALLASTDPGATPA